MYTCANCSCKKSIMVNLPMYGYLCPNCYKEIIVDYLR